jgi:hypothetical protein
MTRESCSTTLANVHVESDVDALDVSGRAFEFGSGGQ